MTVEFRRGTLAAAAALSAGLALSTCQSYDSQVVELAAVKAVDLKRPIAGRFVKPKVMLVVDRSGSMMDLVSGTVGSCSKGGQYDPASLNDCKWKNLRDAFAGTGGTGGMVPINRDLVQFGLTVFPGTGGAACTAGSILVPISETSDNVDSIVSQLFSIAPGGGTPTATTLQNVASDPGMVASSTNQRRAVMLLTDGIPNCNGANQSICDTCKAQGCGTKGECTSCSAAPCSATFSTLFDTNCATENPCLDADSTVAAVTALAAQGIQTFVIGFGQGTNSGSAKSILDRAAIEGGFPRDAQYPTRFYQTNTKDELQKALEDFIHKVQQACVFDLVQTPIDGQQVEVIKHDAEAGSSLVLQKDVEYAVSGNTVEVLGALCAEIRDAPADRYTYEFRYVASL